MNRLHEALKANQQLQRQVAELTAQVADLKQQLIGLHNDLAEVRDESRQSSKSAKGDGKFPIHERIAEDQQIADKEPADG